MLTHCVLQGKYHYIFVYGQHNIDTGGAQLEFFFDPLDDVSDPKALAMVSMSVNRTHATVMLMVRLLPL